MEQPKFYCPYCGLELSGNGHKNDNQAWYLFNCDYNRVRDEKPAIPELEVQKKTDCGVDGKKRKTGADYTGYG